MRNKIQAKLTILGVVSLGLLSILLVACSSAPSPTPTIPITRPSPQLAPSATTKTLNFMALPPDAGMLANMYDRFTIAAQEQGKSVKFLGVAATSPTDLSWYQTLPPPLASIDWKEEIAVLIYMQGGSTSLYNITVKSASQNGDTVRIDCDVKRPPAGAIEPAIVNYFVSAGVLKKTNFQAGSQLKFAFFDQSGNLLAETKAKV